MSYKRNGIEREVGFNITGEPILALEWTAQDSRQLNAATHRLGVASKGWNYKFRGDVKKRTLSREARRARREYLKQWAEPSFDGEDVLIAAAA